MELKCRTENKLRFVWILAQMRSKLHVHGWIPDKTPETIFNERMCRGGGGSRPS